MILLIIQFTSSSDGVKMIRPFGPELAAGRWEW
jgi:hypothetical protein